MLQVRGGVGEFVRAQYNFRSMSVTWMTPSQGFLYLAPPCPMYKDDAGSNSILCGLATDAVSVNSQLIKSLTVLPSTLTAILFHAVEMEGIVKTARGSDCSLFKEVRYNDTS